MNLQEILDYRTNCVLCQCPMSTSIHEPDYPNLRHWIDEKGFHVRSGHPSGVSLDFHFDGSFCRGKRKYKIYARKLTVIKKCCSCSPGLFAFPGDTLNFTTKARSLGISTIANLMNRSTCCTYSFCFDWSSDAYTVEMDEEKIECTDEKNFFYIWNNFERNFAHLQSGSYQGKLDDVFSYRISNAINLSNVKNIEEYINKYRLLMTFS